MSESKQNPMEEIYIPQPIAEMLLIEAVKREIPVEELLTEIITNYMERNDDSGR